MNNQTWHFNRYPTRTKYSTLFALILGLGACHEKAEDRTPCDLDAPICVGEDITKLNAVDYKGVTIVDSELSHLLTFSGEYLRDFVLILPAGSVPAGTVIRATAKKPTIVAELLRRLGLDNATVEITLSANHPLAKEATVILPFAMTEDRRGTRIRLSNERARVIQHQDLRMVKGTDQKTRVSFGLRDWAIISVDQDEEHPSLTLDSSLSSHTSTAAQTISLRSSEAVVGFTASDLVLGNAKLIAFNAKDILHELKLEALSEGLVTIKINKNSFEDLSGHSNNREFSFSFVYDATPPSISGTVATSSLAAGSIDLDWDAATDASAISYEVKWAATNVFTSLDSALRSGNTYEVISSSQSNVSGLDANTSYWMAVIARDAAGNRAMFAPVSFTTLVDFDAPVVTNTTITVTPTDQSALLQWNAATDNVTRAPQYLICQGADVASIDTVAECGAATVIRSWSSSGTQYTVDSLDAVTTYYFNVIAKDASDNKTIYTVATVTTSADVTPPTVGSIAAPTTMLSNATLSWTAATDRETASADLQYYVCYSQSALQTLAACAAASRATNWTANIVTATVTNLSPATRYFVGVMVRDLLGNQSLYASRELTTRAGQSSATHDLRFASGDQHAFYDSANQRHWRSYPELNRIRFEFSADGLTWKVAYQTTTNPVEYALAYKQSGGNAYAFMVATSSNYIVSISRFRVGAKTLSLETTATVFTGAAFDNRYDGLAIAIGQDYVWVASQRYVNSAWSTLALRSSERFDGDLSQWQTPFKVGSTQMWSARISLVAKSGNDVFMVQQHEKELTAFQFNGTTWVELTGNRGGGETLMSRYASLPSAVVQYGGDLIIAGQGLVDAGGQGLGDSLVRWNGTRYLPFGNGNNAFSSSGSVMTMFVDGSDLYIGGNFQSIGGNTSLRRIAKWNGMNWEALGSGISNGLVYSISKFNGEILVGGSFSDAGGVADADRLARWDGQNWHAFAVPLPVSTTYVTSFEMYQGSLYVAGAGITNASGNANARGVVRWTGSEWANLGTGINGIVQALLSHRGFLYAGGAFQDAGGNSQADYLAYWDGAEWRSTSFATHSWTSLLGVYRLFPLPNSVGISGFFRSSTNPKLAYHANITDSEPLVITGGHSHSTITTTLYKGEIVAVASNNGVFDNVGMSHIYKIVNGVSASMGAQSPFGSYSPNRFFLDVNNKPNFMGTYNDRFSTVSKGQFRWNGETWETVIATTAPDPNQAKYLMQSSPTKFFLGTYLGNDLATFGAYGLYTLENGNWTKFPVDSNLGMAELIATLGSYVYYTYGSNFDYIFRCTLNASQCIAINLGATFGFNYSSSMVATSSDLYVSWGPKALRYNGTSWTQLGPDFDAYVDLHLLNGELYAHGYFFDYGADPNADFLVRWNGSAWVGIGAPATGSYNKVTVAGSKMYLMGDFTDLGGNTNIDKFASWDGSVFAAELAPGFRVSDLNYGGHVIDSGSEKYLFYWSSLGRRMRNVAVNDAFEFSASTNQNNQLVIAYSTGSSLQSVTYSSGTWTSPVELSADAPRLPVLEKNGNELFAIWYELGSVVYKTFDGTSWSGTKTEIVPASINPRYPLCSVSSSEVLCSVHSGQASPYVISSWPAAH
jgi:hypothetical protein